MKNAWAYFQQVSFVVMMMICKLVYLMILTNNTTQKNANKVDSIAAVFLKNEVFRLAIAPEGTRKKVTEWKTGFYYIALKANVPIIPVAFDYGKKQVVYNEPYYPTGNIETDIAYLERYFIGVVGKNPDLSYVPKQQ